MILTANLVNYRLPNVVVPCPKRGNVTHALSEARW